MFKTIRSIASYLAEVAQAAGILQDPYDELREHERELDKLRPIAQRANDLDLRLYGQVQDLTHDVVRVTLVLKEADGDKRTYADTIQLVGKLSYSGSSPKPKSGGHMADLRATQWKITPLRFEATDGVAQSEPTVFTFGQLLQIEFLELEEDDPTDEEVHDALKSADDASAGKAQAS